MKQFFTRQLRQFLYKRGYHIVRADNYNFFALLLEVYLARHGELFLIQIGANDGKRFDPVYEFITKNSANVKGILLEPIADYFEELQRNYHNFPNITLLNLAIHNTNTEMTIYRADPEKIEEGKLPQWTMGIASFEKSHHELSGTPAESMIEEKVNCISFSKLLTDHQISSIDLLQIDTEGYDAEILRNLDFKVIKPKIIHFEHGIPDGIMSREQFAEMTDLLHRNDYELWMEEYDCTAYQRNLLVDF